MSNISKVAFIGLGAMGYPMAGHLKRSGLDVCVYNRTETKAFAWADEHDGLSAPTLHKRLWMPKLSSSA